MNTTQLLGMAAGILTSISMLPQLIKIIKEKKADDVSLIMLLVLISGLSLWVAYGVMRDDLPLIVTNSFSVLLNCVIVVFRLKYGHSKT
ncbi:MAG TPA: SemiSWEET transporter [Chitinophagaceae bacterium]|jgi:MtN3 and saliva related transmembrane protein|nr:SemiSWEET transporter [Chitinophagaceae bacterium]